jgi:hypothetical protein
LKSFTTPGEAAETLLQPLLGVCKQNPYFAIQRDEAGGRLLLFYGFALLELFPDAPEHFALRLCAGRLYNAGVPRKVLTEAFRLDIRTIRRVAEALKQEDPEVLAGVLQGRQRPRKLTAEITAFVEAMCDTAFDLHPQAPSRYLLGKVREVFGVSLSAETIRPLLSAYRKQRSASEQNTQTSCDAGTERPAEYTSVDDPQTNEVQPDVTPRPPEGPAEPPPADRKRSVPACQPLLLPHAGLALFLPQLARLAGIDPEDGHLLRYLTACILLGSVNAEQTKILDHAALAFLLGALPWNSPTALRKQIKRLAKERQELRGVLLRFNARFCGHSRPSHVFFDPHTKHYTGKHPVLPGWISSLKRVDKAIHGDWFHGPDGSPLWHRLQDNYDDLRARFLPALRQFREDLHLPADHTLCVVVDRGIYSLETLLECQKEPGLCLLTWDQAYRAGDVRMPGEDVERFTLTRKRNHSRDLIDVRMEAWELSHPRIPGAGLVVCRVHRPGKEPAEIAMIRTGPPLSVRKVVMRMTRRWLQENDFKYTGTHFGLDQITSYRVTPYAKLTGEVEDRQTANGLRLALQEQARELRDELGGLLVTLREGKRRLEKPMAEVQELKDALDTSLDSEVFIALCRKIEQRHKRLSRDIERLQTKTSDANALEKQLVALRKRIKPMPAKLSRLATLIERGNVRHDLEVKTFMDTLRMIARNLFCGHLKSFQSHYDNLRDDHAILRSLTLSPGVWYLKPESPRLILCPGILTTRRNMRDIFNGFLAEIPPPRPPHSSPVTLKTARSEDAFESAMPFADLGT